MSSLHKLRTGYLTHNEAGQLMKRNLTDFDAAGIDTETDLHVKKFVEQTNTDVTLFDKALLQNHKRGDAEILDQLDRARDNDYLILTRQFSVYELSDVAPEVLAYQKLKPVFANYKKLHIMNYEAETNGINHLVEELHSTEYAGHVTTLNMTACVSRLQISNTAFDTRFSERSTETASIPNYDTKMIRLSMLKNYSNFCDYVLSLSNAANTPLYNTMLEIINTNRKYYSDMLARRQGSNKTPVVDPVIPS